MEPLNVNALITDWRLTNLAAYRAENNLGIAPTEEEIANARRLRKRATDLFEMAVAASRHEIPRIRTL